MASHQNLQLRPGSAALSHLVAHYSPDAKLQKVIDSLPSFGVELYSEVQQEARKILSVDHGNQIARIAKRVAVPVSGASAKETTLANSLFDLELAVFFREVTKYIGDNAIASLLTDALLYQATGVEPASATEEEVLDSGTHNVRGIQKFQVARKLMPHIADIEGWTFGKEYSAIISGRPKDFANAIEGAFFSLSRRVQARVHVRYLLYGTLPTKTEQQAMEQWFKDGIEILKKLGSEVTATVNRQTTE
jgi:hypothetical protein